MKTKPHIVDTAIPWIPDGYELIENRSLGKIDLTDISLFTHEKQTTGYMAGEELNKGVPQPLTSSVCKYLLDNPKLIPAQWKEKTNGYTTYIFFHGTILRGSAGYRYVLCLCWHGGEWDWHVFWLDDDWGASSPSAVLAKSSNTHSTLEHRVKVLEQKMAILEFSHKLDK